VNDLQEARRFYGAVFGLPVGFEDANSVVFKFGESFVNLLKATEAPGLVEPASKSRAASSTAGAAQAAE
jgi:extradiol dioxygenase family protein